ncbi:MAG TPA: PEGA domain-containing protein [Bryobacteraceae bacterium]|nr:PEGA domain-containing protein [Bryobacteraceae bacterium]
MVEIGQIPFVMFCKVVDHEAIARLARRLQYKRAEVEMKKGLLILAAALMTMAPMSASAAVRFFVGGPVAYGGWYAPFWGPYWGPYGAYGYYPNSGQVKIDTKVKDAQVFINGAFAGTTKDNKTMHLRPGEYNIEIRENGTTPFAQKVYVAAGQTLHLHPEL